MMGDADGFVCTLRIANTGLERSAAKFGEIFPTGCADLGCGPRGSSEVRVMVYNGGAQSPDNERMRT
jgi:hypothetical protein